MLKPPKYPRRIFGKAFRETVSFVHRKLLISACMAAVVALVRLTHWRFHRITLTWADAWTAILLIVISYVAVILAAFVVNLLRALFLLDRERVDEISALQRNIESSKRVTDEIDQRRDLGTQFADLMREGKTLEEQIITTQNPYTLDNTLVLSRREWRDRVVSAMNDAGWKADAVAFSHSAENPPMTSLENMCISPRLSVSMLSN